MDTFKAIGKALIFWCYLPLAFFLLVCLYSLRGYIKFGKVVSDSDLELNQLSFVYHRVLVHGLLYAIFYGTFIFALALLILAAFNRLSVKIKAYHVIIFIAGIALSIFGLKYVPFYGLFGD